MNSAANPIFRLNTKNPDAVISIIDDSLELNNGIGCDLLSSVSDGEVAMALFDRKRNKFLALEVFQKQKDEEGGWINRLSEKSLILKKKNFRSTFVEVIQSQTTIVPAALFQEGDARKYFDFNFNTSAVLLKTEKIPAYDAVNVYAIPAMINESIQHLFTRPYIYHHSTVLLQAIHLSFKKFNERTLLIHVRQDVVDVVVTEGKQLLFINSFPYRTIDDLVYFVMFVCDRLQLNPETINARLLGQVEEESALFHLLYKYIMNISFADRPDFFEFSYVFDDIPGHFYFNLYNLALCES